MKHKAFFTRAVGLLQPVVLLFLTLLGFLRLKNVMPLPPLVLVSAGLRRFTPSLRDGFEYSLLLVLLYAIYWWVTRQIRRGRWRPSPIVVLGITLLLALPTLLTYPFNANDIYRYVLRGRITALHDGNPFVNPPAAYPAEPLLPMAGQWVDVTSPYGPVWELIAGGAAWTAGEQPLNQLVLFKSLMIGAHLAITGLIWLAQEDKTAAERRWLATLWGWNPSLLLIFGVDGHNDAIMLFWLVAGWVVLRLGLRRQSVLTSTAGLLLMEMGFLTKAIGLLPLPFFGLYALRRFERPAQRVRLLGLSLGGGVLLALLTFLPFGSPMALLARLQSEAGGGASFSIWGLSILEAQRAALWIDWYAVLLITYAVLVLIVLGLLWLVWRGQSPHRAAADALFTFIGLAFNSRIWYAAWPLPFVLLDKRIDSGRLAAALCFLLTSQLSVFIYSHLWSYQFDRSDLITHRWGVAFVFGLPLVAWVVAKIWVRKELGAGKNQS